jgi:SAM-dependent methyltransferase
LAVDRYLGVVTTDERVATSLDIERGFYLRTFRAGGWPGIWRMLRHIRPQSTDVLLDIGCGAGRVVCLAGRMHWRRVIGLDISPEFARLAKQNVASLRARRTEVEIIQTDAAQFLVPDDVTVVFLYNPFRGDVMRETLSRILESVDRTPRRVRILYGNPHEHQVFLDLARFQPTERIRLGWRPGEEWARSLIVQVYEVEPGT